MSWIMLGDEAEMVSCKDLMLLRKYLTFIQKGMKKPVSY